jgi:hypothetical protein
MGGRQAFSNANARRAMSSSSSASVLRAIGRRCFSSACRHLPTFSDSYGSSSSGRHLARRRSAGAGIHPIYRCALKSTSSTRARPTFTSSASSACLVAATPPFLPYSSRGSTSGVLDQPSSKFVCTYTVNLYMHNMQHGATHDMAARYMCSPHKRVLPTAMCKCHANSRSRANKSKCVATVPCALIRTHTEPHHATLTHNQTLLSTTQYLVYVLLSVPPCTGPFYPPSYLDF